MAVLLLSISLLSVFTASILCGLLISWEWGLCARLPAAGHENYANTLQQESKEYFPGALQASIPYSLLIVMKPYGEH